jgi:hypothetical protein
MRKTACAGWIGVAIVPGGGASISAATSASATAPCVVAGANAGTAAVCARAEAMLAQTSSSVSARGL